MDHPLKTFRAARGLSLDALAAVAKTTKSTLSRIEARQLNPTNDLIIRLSDATDGAVTVEQIVRATADRAARMKPASTPEPVRGAAA